jgi:hypothetical protein
VLLLELLVHGLVGILMGGTKAASVDVGAALSGAGDGALSSARKLETSASSAESTCSSFVMAC